MDETMAPRVAEKFEWCPNKGPTMSSLLTIAEYFDLIPTVRPQRWLASTRQTFAVNWLNALMTMRMPAVALADRSASHASGGSTGLIRNFPTSHG